MTVVLECLFAIKSNNNTLFLHITTSTTPHSQPHPHLKYTFFTPHGPPTILPTLKIHTTSQPYPHLKYIPPPSIHPTSTHNYPELEWKPSSSAIDSNRSAIVVEWLVNAIEHLCAKPAKALEAIQPMCLVKRKIVLKWVQKHLAQKNECRKSFSFYCRNSFFILGISLQLFLFL